MVFNIKRCVSSENLNENFLPTLSKTEEPAITAPNTNEIIGSIPTGDSTVPNINPIEVEIKKLPRKKKMFTRFGQLDTNTSEVEKLVLNIESLNSTLVELLEKVVLYEERFEVLEAQVSKLGSESIIRVFPMYSFILWKFYRISKKWLISFWI